MLYEQAISDLERGKITLGEYETRIEPLMHLYYDRPQGEWVWLSSTYDRTPCEMEYWCSNCHHRVVTHKIEPWENFCPNCGARMKGADDE